MIADELFAGAGGWSLAAEALGITAWGVENMPAARATRDAAGLATIHDDVWTYANLLDPDDWVTELLIASPPCQTFSAAGKGAGRKALDVVLSIVPQVADLTLEELRAKSALFLDSDGKPDERTALVLTPLWYAVHFPYRHLAWEQVPQVLPVWEACADVLRNLGWNVATGYLHSEQYGVPQTRKRAFLLASLDHEVALPTPTHSKYHSRTPARLDEGVAPWVSMAEALGWGLARRPSPTVTRGGTETGGAEPIAKLDRYTGREDWVLRMTTMPRSAVRSIHQPAPTIAFGHDAASAQWQIKSRRDSDTSVESDGHRQNRGIEQPAPTITTEAHRWSWCQSPSGITGPVHRPVTHPAATVTGAGNYETHPAGECGRLLAAGANSVRITVEEAGVLQSFPADFPWNGGPKDSKGPKFLQAGNAVPPLMALHALSAATHIPIPKEQPMDDDIRDIEDFWYTHRLALEVAARRAATTGVRQRVERTDPEANVYAATWRIVPALPVELVAS